MKKDFSMTSNKICLKVKFEHIKRSLSQEQLTFIANVNKNTIQKIETDRASPIIKTLEKIANALKINFFGID